MKKDKWKSTPPGRVTYALRLVVSGEAGRWILEKIDPGASPPVTAMKLFETAAGKWTGSAVRLEVARMILTDCMGRTIAAKFAGQLAGAIVPWPWRCTAKWVLDWHFNATLGLVGLAAAAGVAPEDATAMAVCVGR